MTKLREQHDDDALDAWLHDQAQLILTRDIAERVRLRPKLSPRETRASRFARDLADAAREKRQRQGDGTVPPVTEP